MSLELIENEIKKKFEGLGNSGSMGGKSVHEHSSKELLYPTISVDTGRKDENGEPIFESVIDVDSKTELPSPSGTAVLEHYAHYLDKIFGTGRGNGLRYVNVRYKVDMTSKDRKGRVEYTQIASASAMNPDNNENLKLGQAVNKS